MDFSSLPSVSKLLHSTILQNVAHKFAVQIAREVVDELRKGIRQGVPVPEDLQPLLLQKYHALKQPKLRRVINATGIVVHTNLGRAPLPAQAINRLVEVAQGYSNLEMRLRDGKRGGRLDGVAGPLCRLTGAESAIVVNNNAAATLLALTALCQGKEVLVSRGELVEIGGSFRIPDVISSCGAKLIEVGTTNRTYARDYQDAISERTGAILRIHPSNFRIVGFHYRPPRNELAAVAKQANIPFIEDIGSGLLELSSKFREQMAEDWLVDALKDGVDVLCFSGDKLLGGAQAGFLAGTTEYIQRCRRHPLYRAMRICKLSLAALEGTLKLYEEGRLEDIPVWRMLHKDLHSCQQEAGQIAAHFPAARVLSATSYTGGGALPDQAIPTYVCAIPVAQPNEVAAKLRQGTPAVVVRIVQDEICIDPRTLLAGDIEPLVASLRACINGS